MFGIPINCLSKERCCFKESVTTTLFVILDAMHCHQEAANIIGIRKKIPILRRDRRITPSEYNFIKHVSW